MDQDSTGKGSGGDRRNWRERLGINKDLPRLSEEFKSDQAPKRPEPRPNQAPAQRSGGQPPRPLAPPPRPGGQPPVRPPQPPQRPTGQQPVRPPQPAPAPAQRPTGQQPVRPPQPAPAQRPGTPVARRPAPMAPRPAAQGAPMAPRPSAQAPAEPPPAGAHRPPTPPRPAPSRPAPPRPAPSQAAAARPVPQRPAAPTQPPVEPRPDHFAERLKVQREAAERLAQQRMQQARSQVVVPSHGAPPSQAAPVAQEVEGGPKFTFAQEEIAQAQRETKPSAPVQQPPAGYSYQPTYQGTGNYQPPAQPYGRVPPPPGYQGGAYQPRPYPQDYRPAAPGAYPGQRPPDRDWQDEAEAGQVRRAPVPVPDAETEPDDRGTLPPGRGLQSARGRADEYAKDDLGDVFEDEDERPLRRGRARARAEDYSAAYRTYEDEFEEDEPRSRGGPLVLLLALMAVALIAGGLIYWYVSQKQQTADTSGNVPVITAPQEPVKTAPEPTSQQDEASQQATAPQQPVGRKQIYDRILGDETLEPERIVPTEEQPQMPVPGQDSNSQSQGTGQQQGIEPLPLPLPPPPESTGQQGRLDVPQSIGKSDPNQVQGQGQAQDQAMVAEPASQNGSRSDLAVGKSDSQAQTGSLNLPVPEMPSQEMVQQQSQETVQTQDQQTQQSQQSSEQQQLQQIIETDQTPEPAPKPQKPKLVEKSQPVVEQRQVVVAPPPPQQQASVQQPVNQGTGPISLSPLSPQANQFNQPVQQPQQFQAPQQTETSTRTTTRLGGPDDDPLEGQRVPFSSPSTQSAQNSQQPSDLNIINQQPVVQPQPVIQPQQQQVASIQQPQPQPQPQPRVGTGYVAQLAAFRSEAEAQNEYQRLAQRHASLLSGLAPRIQRADLGASGSFYRLSVGTLASEAAARKLCNALISAGERDCLVRRQ